MALRPKNSTPSHLDITPSPPLTSFIFVPSRDLRSLRGASLDTFRYFPLENSEKPLHGPFLPSNEHFSQDFFTRLAPLHWGSYTPIRHQYRALVPGLQARRVPLIVLGLQSNMITQYDFTLDCPRHAVQGGSLLMLMTVDQGASWMDQAARR